MPCLLLGIQGAVQPPLDQEGFRGTCHWGHTPLRPHPPTADTLQTHSVLFLEEMELVPSTPTSASGAFWKGTELGTEAAVPPAAQSTTSEVVKSKSGASLVACRVGGPGSTPEVQQFPPTPPTQHPARALGGKEGGGRGGEAPPDPLLPARPCSPGALVGDQEDRLLAVLPRGAHCLPHRHAAPPLPRQLLGVGRRGGLHPAAGGPRARGRDRGRGWMGWGLHPHRGAPLHLHRPPACPPCR